MDDKDRRREEKVFTFDLNEINKKASSNPLSIKALFKDIVHGYYPELYSNELLISERYYSDYIESYIERDVSDMINIKDKFAFRRFMELLGSLTGEELIYDNKCCKIKLNWTYENGKDSKEIEAPSFTYDLINGNTFYQDEDCVFGPDIKYIKDNNISEKNRYIVQITPQSNTSENPFSKKVYSEINSINNNNFSFRISDQIYVYSYYCCGFTIGNIYKNFYEFGS